MTRNSTALSLVLAVAAAPLAAQEALSDAEIITLSEWTYDDLYAGGVSADDFIDEMEVYGVNGEEIGDVEDIIIGPDGRILSIVAEVGGFWDIGDTHISVPYDEVEMGADGIVIPVTEENVEVYAFDGRAVVEGEALSSDTVAGLDDAALARAWRASEMIGDQARLRTAEGYGGYGYVSDLILSDGEVSAVVVQPSAGYGMGYRAYPYYGYGYGWDAGSPYYDMPYGEDEIVGIEPFEYDRLGS